MTRVSKSVVIVLGLTVSFAAGHVTANGYATRINLGFLNAFNSAGQNLFGSAVFGAQALPPEELPPSPEDREPETVQVDFLTNSQIHTLLNVVEPPDADAPHCRVGLQVEIGGDGSVSVIVDPDVYDPELIEIGTPTGVPPRPCANGNVLEPGDG